LLVLAAHLLPLGPKQLRLNEAFGTMGMAIFFTLSGFLITRLLLANQNVTNFLIKRTLRIVPLAWVAIAVALLMEGSSSAVFVKHLLFYANIPPIALTSSTAHLWSLCVEMQFYFGAALVVGLFGRPGLFAIPVLCILVTFYRMLAGIYIDIVSVGRVDEILAGAILGLIYADELSSRVKDLIARANPVWIFPILLLASSPYGEWLNYFRPYLAAALVGSTLLGRKSSLNAI